MTPEFKARFIDLIILFMGTAILFACLHVMPWRKVFRREVKPPFTYIAGVLGMGICFVWLVGFRWHDWWAVWAGCAVACGAGAPVFTGYDIRMRLQVDTLKKELHRTLRLADDLIKGVRARGNGEKGNSDHCRPV